MTTISLRLCFGFIVLFALFSSDLAYAQGEQLVYVQCTCDVDDDTEVSTILRNHPNANIWFVGQNVLMFNGAAYRIWEFRGLSIWRRTIFGGLAPIPEPESTPVVAGVDEQAGCNNQASSYTIEFVTMPIFEDSHTYRLEKQISSGWVEEYDGPNDSRTVVFSVEQQTFRLRGTNSNGTGEWTEFTLTNYCNAAGQPPGYKPRQPQAILPMIM